MRPPRLALVLAVALAAGCSDTPDGGPDDEDGVAAAAEAGAEAVDQARVLLDTDRPWSAARVLRPLTETPAGLEPATRLLAARAEAGWGDWPRVRTVLDGALGLDSLGGGLGLYLLARAHDEADSLDAARAGYDAFLAVAADSLETERGAAELRRALVLARQDPDAGDRALAVVPDVAPGWRAVLEAEALARDGLAGRVEALASRVSGPEQTRRMWAARVEATRRSGDLAAARRLAGRARAGDGTKAGRAAFTLTAGQLAAEAGDGAAARALYRDAVEASPASPAARAAADLLRRGRPAPADWLAIARADRALGLNAEAADAFGQWLGADEGTPAQRADVHYRMADALFDAQRYDEVEAALAPIQSQPKARELWAGTLGRTGRTDESAEVYLALAESNALPNLYFAADVLHQGGALDRALPLYRRVARAAPGSVWAGLATMRLAGQAFLDQDYAQAAGLWDGYGARQPRGREALQALYWSGRAHAAAGDTTAAGDRFRRVLRQARDSYYALLASQALGEPFWPVPTVAPPPDDPAAAARVERALRGADVLREAGFPEAAEAELDRAAAGVGRGQAERYALAEALVARGYGQRAIRIGQSLGGGTNLRRLRILYPFPFRRLVAAEARANGVDPFTAAALIRQESQFSQRATSYVGARGLMQLMPATGRTLAAEVGVDGWDPDLLYVPEVNVHLGARYVGQQAAAYDGALPAVFGAYNAGPHQIEAWREFPEWGRDALFTERIPFRETREYVKILTRNRAIYQGLYGAD